MQQRQYIHAAHLQYRGLGTELTVSMDGGFSTTLQLPDQGLKRRRVTLPQCLFGTFAQYQFNSIEPDCLCEFERVEETAYEQVQLFHYYELGFLGSPQLQIQLDQNPQAQTFTAAASVSPDSIRIYFDQLAYGYVPHIHNSSLDGEILWARPVALPPRFYRGIRSHAEFQITYSGDVTLQWYLDGVALGDPYVLPTTSSTTTEKLYFQAGAVGHVLQYRVLNPTAGRVYVVETDVTLSDLEQQTMTQNSEERI